MRLGSLKFWSVLLPQLESARTQGDMPRNKLSVRNPSATERYSRGSRKPRRNCDCDWYKSFSAQTVEGVASTEALLMVMSTPHGVRFWPAFACLDFHDGFCVGSFAAWEASAFTLSRR